MGSSPQVRGTPEPDRRRVGRGGLIPAGAGNTPERAWPCRQRQAHPRRCGEHPSGITAVGLALGSSPQVRGTRGWRRWFGEHLGLIPAGAGNTRCPPADRVKHRAHPRRCGEHYGLAEEGLMDSGSSPQVRGTREGLPARSYGGGLIPAGAGNTRAPGFQPGDQGAHPRRCGEHPDVTYTSWSCGGSSPQVRGTHLGARVVVVRQRLIPAGAGNTGTRSATGTRSGAHPRRCGEHGSVGAYIVRLGGSSPQVRGTRRRRRHARNGGRLIPAGAGNTCRSSSWASPATAHPRRCGEHYECIASRASSLGSSPQVRGTPWVLTGVGVIIGLIPAGAGNTRGSA